MKRSNLIIFIGFFLAVISIVPLVQAIFELRTNKKIQVFDLVIDAAATPLTRAQKMHALARQLSDCAAFFEKTLALGITPEVGAKTDTLEKVLDDASSAAADLKKNVLTINRYVSRDSSDKEIKTITSCARLLDTLGSMLRAGPAPRICGKKRQSYRSWSIR